MKLKVNDLLGEKEGGIRPAITFTMRRCPESQPQPDGQVLSQRLVRIRKTYIARVLCTRLAVHVCVLVRNACRSMRFLFVVLLHRHTGYHTLGHGKMDAGPTPDFCCACLA